ncbi:MAG TPA: diaminopimelate epimerase [Polyangiaceae bacterium]
MGAPLHFDKYEGLGNDFILVEAADAAGLSVERVVRLCDRRFGVGADGVLLVLPAHEGPCAARMSVVNADGSVPEMCGNGLRCVATHLAAKRAHPAGPLRIETDAGERDCAVGDDGEVTVDMGIVRALGERAVDVDGKPIVLALGDAGNPHAVLFGTFARGDVERLGPRIATHAAFPRGTNVEFARVEGDGIDLVVWERGVGVTMACGTGACAAVAVAVAGGLLPAGRAVTVQLPGGRLEVRIAVDGRATMRGPARHVFSGIIE